MVKITHAIPFVILLASTVTLTACDEGLDDSDLGLGEEQGWLGDEVEELSADAIDDGLDEPSQLSTKPKLWAPYPWGVSYRCTQGYDEPYSHDATTTKYALDFDTPNSGSPRPILAALAGRVDYVQTGCVEGVSGCGGGFGNHVKLSHGGGYYTMYAHLASVAVTKGAKVGRAQELGKEGSTGESNGDHLHFSLHQGDATSSSVAPSVGYSIQNKDVTGGGALAHRQATSHICGLETGHFYQSNNICSTKFDSRNTAKKITNETTYLGETCSVGDTDYFYLSGTPGPFAARVRSTDESIFDCSCAILNSQGVELEQGGPEGYMRDDFFHGSEGCGCSMANASASTYYLKIYTQMPGSYWFSKTLP